MTKRTFLVTGASKGIGRALSTQLAAAGHHAVGVAHNPDPSFPGTLVSIDLDDDEASARPSLISQSGIPSTASSTMSDWPGCIGLAKSR